MADTIKALAKKQVEFTNKDGVKELANPGRTFDCNKAEFDIFLGHRAVVRAPKLEEGAPAPLEGGAPGHLVNATAEEAQVPTAMPTKTNAKKAAE